MKTLTGKIVSTAMKDTVVVEIEQIKKHPMYKKIIRRSRRMKAHATDAYAIGDVVEIVETRPISKEKHYKVSQKLS